VLTGFAIQETVISVLYIWEAMTDTRFLLVPWEMSRSMLEQGHVEAAAQAYAEDLGLDKSLTRAHQHPNNEWALHCYHECLTRLEP
jgi:hypothetical protein